MVRRASQVLAATIGSVVLPFLALVAALPGRASTCPAPLYWVLVGALGLTAA